MFMCLNKLRILLYVFLTKLILFTEPQHQEGTDSMKNIASLSPLCMKEYMKSKTILAS